MRADIHQRPNAVEASLFAPLKLGRRVLRNRLAVAPMTRVSATADGLATSSMASYYAAFAAGGFALVVTEGVYTDTAYSQGYLFQPGMTSSLQRDAWRVVVDGVHGHGACIVAQLMHAGALSQGNPFRPDTKGPSALQPKGQQMGFYRGDGPYRLPKPMSLGDIREVVSGFAQAAALAKAAGFDGVEIHGANGYLLDQFLTDHSNARNDEYGGGVKGRLKLITEVIDATRRAVGADFLVGLRISQGKVNDFGHRWAGGEADAALIFRTLGQQPIDYLHTTEFEAWQPAFGEYGPSLAALARRCVTVPLLANGSLHDPVRAAALLGGDEADMVSLGRGALTHPDWPDRVRAGMPLDTFDGRMLAPIADLANADRQSTFLRNAG